MKTITVYVPIDRYIQTEFGEDHVIKEHVKAISRETYNNLCAEREQSITKKIEPIVADIKNLISEIEDCKFDVEIDTTQVTILHSYCPTLNRDQAIIAGKELKNMSDNQKVKFAQSRYIDILQKEIDERLTQRQAIIDDFI